MVELLWEKDEIIGRLAKESKGLRKRLSALKELAERANPELYYSSPRGAVQALLRRLEQLELHLSDNDVDVPDWK